MNSDLDKVITKSIQCSTTKDKYIKQMCEKAEAGLGLLQHPKWSTL